LWANGLNVKDIHKEILTVYGGKCLSRKAVHNSVEKFSQGRSEFADDGRSGRPGAELAEIIVRNFCAAGFDALVKRWDMCINVGGGYVDINVFFFEIRISHVLYPFVTIY
jgi:hypothetical protein